MANLRIQEFLDARGLTRTDLSRLTDIAENVIGVYADESIDLNQETAQNIRTISAKLNIPAAKLIRPVDKKAGVRLKILEEAKLRDLTLTQISEDSNVHPLVLGFYSTQVLLKDKWQEARTQEDIGRIAAVLKTSPTELSVVQDPSITQLRVKDFLQEKGITLEELSLLYDAPPEFISLLASQPFDFSLIQGNRDKVLLTWCEIFACRCPC
jgi:transcriptional regulator with XRE-family HTH domain